jgi:ankyrin repeat protein
MALEPKRAHTQSATEGSENDANALVALLSSRAPDLTLLRYLSPRDLGRLAQTCQRLRVAIADRSFWAHLSSTRVIDFLGSRAKRWSLQDAPFRRSVSTQAGPDATTPTPIPDRMLLSAQLAPLVTFAGQSPLGCTRAVNSRAVLDWLCTFGRLDVIKTLFEHTRRTNEDARPFHSARVIAGACRSGNLSLVQYLHERVGVTRQEMRIVNSALGTACEYGWVDIVAYLFETVHLTLADVRMYGYAALSAACIHGHINVVRYLADHGGLTRADFLEPARNRAPLAACRNGHTELVRYLFERFDIPVRTIRHDHWKMLHDTCAEGYSDIFRYLLDRLNAPRAIKLHATALLLSACRAGSVEIVQTLCAIAGEMYRQRTAQYAAFHAAYTHGHVGVVRYLVEYFQMDGQAVRMNNNAALHTAIVQGFKEIVVYLCEKAGLTPADVRAENYSMIRCALEKGHIDIARYLCLYIQLAGDEMPAVRAAILRHMFYSMQPVSHESLQFLISVLNLDLYHPTTLAYAVEYGRISFLRYLLDSLHWDHRNPKLKRVVRDIFILACEFGDRDVAQFVFNEAGLTAADVHADETLLLAALASPNRDILMYINKDS